MTFCPPALLFLQDFCKNAQWRAKKLRERGSNTARPTEKDGGGLPIGARPVDFGASIRRASCRFRRVDSVTSCRFRRADTMPTPTTRHKKPDSSIGGSGSTIARRRADTMPTPTTRHKKARFLNRGIGLNYRKASRS